MPPAALPADEAERRATLVDSGLLESKVSDRAQIVVELASTLLQRPSAAFSLVDTDHQFFRPGVGLPFTSTPRHVSFCAHAILNPHRTLVVEDGRLDPRFADNGLVTSGAVRFYAGAPVTAPNGKPLGALCVLDRVPGTASPLQISILQGLARELEAIVQRPERLEQDCAMSTLELKYAILTTVLAILAARERSITDIHLAAFRQAPGMPSQSLQQTTSTRWSMGRPIIHHPRAYHIMGGDRRLRSQTQNDLKLRPFTQPSGSRADSGW